MLIALYIIMTILTGLHSRFIFQKKEASLAELLAIGLVWPFYWVMQFWGLLMEIKI